MSLGQGRWRRDPGGKEKPNGRGAGRNVCIKTLKIPALLSTLLDTTGLYGTTARQRPSCRLYSIPILSAQFRAVSVETR
eukprot:scaffold311898_cov35-Tisochrysis_lutea.AAC.3